VSVANEQRESCQYQRYQEDRKRRRRQDEAAPTKRHNRLLFNLPMKYGIATAERPLKFQRPVRALSVLIESEPKLWIPCFDAFSSRERYPLRSKTL
jgi:hypothetical protein